MDFNNPYIKVLVWLIPVIFGAGGLYASAAGTADKVTQIEARVMAVDKALDDHSRQGVGHSGTGARLSQIERNQIQFMERQERATRNIAAICQATGANCK